MTGPEDMFSNSDQLNAGRVHWRMTCPELSQYARDYEKKKKIIRVSRKEEVEREKISGFLMTLMILMTHLMVAKSQQCLPIFRLAAI